jgi:hypothetical protein
MTTICAKCRYYYFERSEYVVNRTSDYPIWYEQFCTAPAYISKKELDPVSGRKVYTDGQKHPNCRDKNNGSCPEFSSRVKELS